MTITINLDRALELIDEAVAERGEDYVYPEGNCVYARYDEGACGTACLVGDVLARAGVTFADLLDLEGSVFKLDGYDSGPNDLTIEEWGSLYPVVVGDSELMGVGIELDLEAVMVLQAAQNEQDLRKTWGQARDLAHEVADAIRGRS